MNSSGVQMAIGHPSPSALDFVEGGSLSITAVAAGFFFSFRTITVLISARALGIGSEPGVIANFVIGLLLFLVVAFQTVGGDARLIARTWKIPTMRWVWCFLLVSLCSLAWSATISPVASLFYWLELAFDVVTVTLLVLPSGGKGALHSLLKGFIWGSVVLAIIAWIMPLESDLRLGDQEYFNTNQIGNLCAISVFLCQLLRGREMGHHKIPALLLGLTLLRSLSKATLVAFAAGQIYLYFSNRRAGRKRSLTSVLWLGLVVLLFSGLYATYYEAYTTTGNQAETLTGRTAIWIYCFNAALQRPWLGNGIDSLWKVVPPFGNELFEARHAENEILQQFYSYGIAGVVLLLGLYRSLYRRIRSLSEKPLRAVLTALVIYVLIRGLAEAEPFDLLLPLWLIAAVSFGIGISRFSERNAAWQPYPARTMAGPDAGRTRGIPV